MDIFPLNFRLLKVWLLPRGSLLESRRWTGYLVPGRKPRDPQWEPESLGFGVTSSSVGGPSVPLQQMCVCVCVCLGVCVCISERSWAVSQLLSCVYLFIFVGFKNLWDAQTNYLRQGLNVTLWKQSSLFMLTFIVGETTDFMKYNFPRCHKIKKQSFYLFIFILAPAFIRLIWLATPPWLLLPLLGLMKVLSAPVDFLCLGRCFSLSHTVAGSVGVVPPKCQTAPHCFASAKKKRVVACQHWMVAAQSWARWAVVHSGPGRDKSHFKLS